MKLPLTLNDAPTPTLAWTLTHMDAMDEDGWQPAHLDRMTKRVLSVLDTYGDLKSTAADLEDGLRRDLEGIGQGSDVAPVAVDCVACGYEALQMYEKNIYDVVVMGPVIRLSHGDGIEALEFIRIIAHITECAEEPLCPILLVMNRNLDSSKPPSNHLEGLQQDIAACISVVTPHHTKDIYQGLAQLLAGKSPSELPSLLPPPLPAPPQLPEPLPPLPPPPGHDTAATTVPMKDHGNNSGPDSGRPTAATMTMEKLKIPFSTLIIQPFDAVRTCTKSCCSDDKVSALGDFPLYRSQEV